MTRLIKRRAGARIEKEGAGMESAEFSILRCALQTGLIRSVTGSYAFFLVHPSRLASRKYSQIVVKFYYRKNGIM